MNRAGIPLKRTEIRKLTSDLRKMFGLENTTFFPIVRFIELLANEPNLDFNYCIVDDEELPDCYANTCTTTGMMLIRESVYTAAVKDNPRHRFTLCHELGHYLLHGTEFISFARGDVPTYQQPEWQANTFAGELLAPYELIQNMSVPEIMEKCGMSKQAATIQYNEAHRCKGVKSLT